jgi:ABC-type multidrug transport system permease subunit
MGCGELRQLFTSARSRLFFLLLTNSGMFRVATFRNKSSLATVFVPQMGFSHPQYKQNANYLRYLLINGLKIVFYHVCLAPAHFSSLSFMKMIRKIWRKSPPTPIHILHWIAHSHTYKQTRVPTRLSSFTSASVCNGISDDVSRPITDLIVK